MVLKKGKKKDYPKILFILYIIIWLILAVNPVDRKIWFFESFLIFPALFILIWTYPKFKFSNKAYFFIFLFLLLHTIGGHYTYSRVPFGFWLAEVFNLSRNHYDRIVHFSFGFLIAIPFREFFAKVAKAKGAWAYYLPLCIVISFSALYEIAEFFVVAFMNPVQGALFLGQQGDIWDSQKDMFLATTGAFISLSTIFIIRIWRRGRKSKGLLKRLFKRMFIPLAE